MKTLKSKSVLGGLVLVLMLAALGVAAPVAAAPANAIVVHAQDTNSGQVIVDSVTAAQDGWLLIRKDANGVPGNVLGFAPVQQGVNTNVVVDIRTTNANGDDDVTARLWATLVADSYATLPFESPDSSITREDSLAIAAFSSTLAGGAAPALASAAQIPTTGGISSVPSVNKIAVKAQDTNSGQVLVNSVTATQDGWLLIWKDANGAPAGLLGFAPVHQGLNTNVVVDIKLFKANGSEDVTPTLWATLVADPYATLPFASPDSSITSESSLMMVPFSSTLD